VLRETRFHGDVDSLMALRSKSHAAWFGSARHPRLGERELDLLRGYFGG
jgi:hypothetical protein